MKCPWVFIFWLWRPAKEQKKVNKGPKWMAKESSSSWEKAHWRVDWRVGGFWVLRRGVQRCAGKVHGRRWWRDSWAICASIAMRQKRWWKVRSLCAKKWVKLSFWKEFYCVLAQIKSELACPALRLWLRIHKPVRWKVAAGIQTSIKSGNLS